MQLKLAENMAKPIKFLTEAEWNESSVRKKIYDLETKIMNLISSEEERGYKHPMLWKELGFLQGMKAMIELSDEVLSQCISNLETRFK